MQITHQIKDYKYLGASKYQYNNMHNEIHLRISAANKDYYVLRKFFTLKLLSRQSKECLYLSFLQPVFE